MAVDPYNIGIQMNQKELTNSFMMISNWKTTWFIQKYFSVIKVKIRRIQPAHKLYV